MEKIRNNSGYLHCFPFPRGGYGGRLKLPVESDIRPVYGQVTVVSLLYACLANGLLEGWNKNDPVDFESLRESAESQWENSIKKFLGEVDPSQSLVQRAEEWAANQKGVTIGWSFADEFINPDFAKFEFCEDFSNTLAVLSRCTGDMFIAAREPDYSWGTLFGQTFAFDDYLLRPSNERGQ